MMLLTAIQANALLTTTGRAVEISLDLGVSTSTVHLEDGVVIFPDGQRVDIKRLRRVSKDDESIYAVQDDGLIKVSLFCEKTNKYYKLHPTSSWPALVISGITMHRISGTDPQRDVANKIELLSPIRGPVLDTCCGLGYTAIGAARGAESVITVEKDPNVIDLAEINPHSRPLFDDDRITLMRGDVSEIIRSFADGSFSLVIHDPPTLSIAGELYADDFYRQLLRVLRRGGTLFHYTGAPGSRNRKIDLPRSVARRLGEIGFAGARPHALTLSVVARRK